MALLRFTCNVCGTSNEAEESAFGREASSCGGCGSSVRVRSLVHLLSRELFGQGLTLDEFPTLKGVRGIGCSDWENYASRLAGKLDYRNTHYHLPPRLDVADPEPEHEGKYDFLIASEVFEHVAPPVERAFERACRMLKPRGFFLLTVPFSFEATTAEHFPDLHQYAVVPLGSRYVLVNRAEDGRVEVREDLVFHGGVGSTLEMRLFSQEGLRQALLGAGFEAVEFRGENHLEHGIVRSESWSLPVVARKRPFAFEGPALAEFVDQLRVARRGALRAERLGEEFEAERLGLHRWVEAKEREAAERTSWALQCDADMEALTRRQTEMEQELTRRTEWAQGLEADLKARTEWARALERESLQWQGRAAELEAELAERTRWAEGLEAEAGALRARLERLTKWVPSGLRRVARRWVG